MSNSHKDLMLACYGLKFLQYFHKFNYNVYHLNKIFLMIYLFFREKKSKRRLLESVQEFSLACRGLIGTEYARQSLASKQMVAWAPCTTRRLWVRSARGGMVDKVQRWVPSLNTQWPVNWAEKCIFPQHTCYMRDTMWNCLPFCK